VADGKYKIKKGDSLGAIAKQHDISVVELAKANGIKDVNKIAEGKELTIPAGLAGFSKKELIQASKTGKVDYSKKIYKGLDSSAVDNHKVVLDYHKQNPGKPFTVVDKITNTVYRYDEKGKLSGKFRAGLGKDKGDEYTINSNNEAIDRNTTGAGIFTATPNDLRYGNQKTRREYGDSSIKLTSERGIEQATLFHEIPKSTLRKRGALLNDKNMENDDFSNGCVNCNKADYERYIAKIKEGEKVYILPEDPGNFFKVKDGELAFTTNKKGDFGQVNYSPRSKKFKPFEFEVADPTETKTKYVDALKKEKQNLMKDLNLTSDEYDQLAQRAYGILGQESNFGNGSFNPKNDYKIEKHFVDLFDSEKEKESRSLGLTQVRMKYVNKDFAKKYGITTESLYNPYQAALATMERLTDAYQAVKQPGIRDKYPDATPENMYDYAVTFYNKPQTVRKGQASGKNTYVQRVQKNYKDSIPQTGTVPEKPILASFEGGGIQQMGYKRNSPFKKHKTIDIQSNHITMDNVDIPLMLIPDNDTPVIAPPNSGDYLFAHSQSVKEIPMKRYKKGGLTKFPKTPRSMSNAEVEGEETALTPEGQLYEFEGPSHEEGGIPVSLPEGTQIFSEHRKAPAHVVAQLLGKKKAKKMSYAELSKKFPLEDHQDTLEDINSDKFQLETAKLGYMTNQGKLQEIFLAQEMGKGKKAQKEFQLGGMVPLRQYQVTDNASRRTGTPGMTGPNGEIYDPLTGEFILPMTTNTQYGGRKFGASDNAAKTTYADPRAPVQAPEPITDPRWKWTNTAQAEATGPEVVREVYVQKPGYLGPEQSDETSNVWPNLATGETPAGPLDIVMPERKTAAAPVPPVAGRPGKPSSKRTPGKVAPAVTKPGPFPDFAPLPVWSEDSMQVDSEAGAPDISEFKVDESAIQRGEEEQNKRFNWKKFGISPKLAGTIADIGLAMSDGLNVEAPYFQDNRKYPLFRRFQRMDSKEPARMYSKLISQIQNSNMPEGVKTARMAEVLANFEDQQAQVDMNNVARYDQKQEADINKLQAYMDRNQDQHQMDIDNYRERKAKVNYLRDQFNAQKKSRIVNALRGYANYAEQVHMANQLYADNYKINPITGKIDFVEKAQPQLDQNILQQYQKNSNNTVQLPGGANATQVGNLLIVTSANGSVEVKEIGSNK
jgi:LysM repeat protein